MPDDMDNLKTLPPTQNVNNGSLTFNPDNVHEANGANQVPHLQALNPICSRFHHMQIGDSIKASDGNVLPSTYCGRTLIASFSIQSVAASK